jgi:hypothetical protein
MAQLSERVKHIEQPTHQEANRAAIESTNGVIDVLKTKAGVTVAELTNGHTNVLASS